MTSLTDEELIKQYRDQQAALNGGCSDGYCVIEKTVGMHTNGGCSCLRNLDFLGMRRVGVMLKTAQIMADRIEALAAELDLMKTAGVIEIASRNNRVTEYMFHWEGRALDAEAKLAECEARLSKAVEALRIIAEKPIWGQDMIQWIGNVTTLVVDTLAELEKDT